MNFKKICLVAAGSTGLALGAVGAVLPMLPTVPFLLLAATCFAKSSETLDAWFKSTNLYKNNLEHYVKGQGMPQKTKIRIMLLVTALMGFGFVMMSAAPVGRIILAIVWLCHIAYFSLIVKTR